MTQTQDAFIELKNITFTYPGGAVIFKDFSWQVNRGEAWAIIGPSGCGKSTLLYLIAGLRRPVSGQLLVDNQPISRPRPQTGLILQDYGLLPWATVRDNAALGLDIRRFYGPDGKHTPRDEQFTDRDERVDYWLRRLGIDHVAHQYPNQISGGQRQRTAIARTLVLNPDLLLMDEPFGALDALTRENLQNLTLELRAERNLTTIIVTHNIDEAVFMGQKILVLTQPPTTQAIIVDNPQAGTSGYRQEELFFTRCNELRRLLEEPVP
ncbi:MAG: ABC transporter ATP-binding protein [Chloroflexi bacterium]|nr:MAG: ABC transporter ATP-binding protein [Chloroflexota bacterium]